MMADADTQRSWDAVRPHRHLIPPEEALYNCRASHCIARRTFDDSSDHAWRKKEPSKVA